MRCVSLRQPSLRQVEGSFGVYALRLEDTFLSHWGLDPADPDLLEVLVTDPGLPGSVEPLVVGLLEVSLRPTGGAEAEVVGVDLGPRIPLPRPTTDRG